jgi:hypothetical protein
MRPPHRSRRSRHVARAASVAFVVLIGSLAIGSVPVTAGPDAPASGFDQYGGWAGHDLTATGFFRTERVDGRWWLVTPDGHPFFSNGVNNVTPVGSVDRNGHAAYHEAVLAKYGSDQAWAAAQAPRLRGWGMNTLGGWGDPGLFAGLQMPYTLTLSLTGQDSGSGRLADFWDPAWVTGVQQSTASAAAGHVDDPWLVGYYLDNEVHWTRDWRPDQLDLGFQRDPGAPGKVHLVDWLRRRYHGSFAAFAGDFTSSATGWATLAEATKVTAVGPGAQGTRNAWSGELAGRFFSVAHDALRAADPNHLDLGSRFIAQLLTPEVLRAAARHVDVVSINWYEITKQWEGILPKAGADFIPTADTLAATSAIADMPLLITEFGWRAMDSGLPNTYPPLQVVVQTQQDRADAYRNFGQCLVNTGNVVGAHWFEMTDEPAIGRFDGEDDNWGLVNEADDPYQPVVDASLAVHDAAYAPLTDPNWQPGPCTPIGPQRVEPPPTTTTTTAAGSSTTTSTAPVAPPTPTPATPVPGAPTFTG